MATAVDRGGDVGASSANNGMFAARRQPSSLSAGRAAATSMLRQGAVTASSSSAPAPAPATTTSSCSTRSGAAVGIACSSLPSSSISTATTADGNGFLMDDVAAGNGGTTSSSGASRRTAAPGGSGSSSLPPSTRRGSASSTAAASLASASNLYKQPLSRLPSRTRLAGGPPPPQPAATADTTSSSSVPQQHSPRLSMDAKGVPPGAASINGNAGDADVASPAATAAAVAGASASVAGPPPPSLPRTRLFGPPAGGGPGENIFIGALPLSLQPVEGTAATGGGGGNAGGGGRGPGGGFHRDGRNEGPHVGDNDRPEGAPAGAHASRFATRLHNAVVGAEDSGGAQQRGGPTAAGGLGRGAVGESPLPPALGRPRVIPPQQQRALATAADDDDDSCGSFHLSEGGAATPSPPAKRRPGGPNAAGVGPATNGDHASGLGPLDLDHEPATKRPSREESTILVPAPRYADALLGFTNIGNTCFMNSALQCLLRTPRVLEFLLARRRRSDPSIGTTSGVGTGGLSSTPSNQRLQSLASVGNGKGGGETRRAPLTDALSDVTKQMFPPVGVATAHAGRMGGGGGGAIAPSHFKHCMGAYARAFQGSQQHDAQEFLRFALDGIHEETNRVTVKPKYEELKDVAGEKPLETARRWMKNHLSRNDSVIQEAFLGQLHGRSACGTCGHKDHSFDLFMDVSVPIPSASRGSGHSGGITLYDCLARFTAAEPCELRCAKCKSFRQGTQQIQFLRLPETLVIHLKRFGGVDGGASSFSTFRRSKVSDLVTFPLDDLDILPFLSSDAPEVERSAALYDLTGVVNHRGTCHGGHYTSYCLCTNPNNSGEGTNPSSWYEFDDSMVERVGDRGGRSVESAIVTSSAYLLFYRRKTMPAGLAARFGRNSCYTLKSLHDLGEQERLSPSKL